MHEMSLVDALFDQVDEALRPHPRAQLRLVRVRIGALAGVEPALFQTAFDELRLPRQHPHAALELVWQAGRWRCPLCRGEVAPGEALRCPSCAVAAELAEGDGIFLDHLELEVPDV